MQSCYGVVFTAAQNTVEHTVSLRLHIDNAVVGVIFTKHLDS